MSEALRSFLTLDLAPLLAVTFAAGTLGLLGSFLVLERRGGCAAPGGGRD